MGLDGVSVKLVQTVADAGEFMAWLGERRPVLGFDTETTGLFPFNADVCRLAQFGDARTGWSIPFERWSGIVDEVIRTYTGPIVGHNVRFDQRFMHRHGVTPIPQHLLHDSMLAASLLFHQERLSLKELSALHVDPDAKLGEYALQEAMSKGGWTWATVPIDLPEYWAYGALDTVLSAQLFEQMQPRLKSEGLWDLYELEMATSAALFKMEKRGAHVDLPYCDVQYEHLKSEAQTLRLASEREYGFSPTNKDEVVHYLANEGYKFRSRTPTGTIKLDEDVLSRIDHPLAKTILQIRENEKLANTYFRNIIKLADPDANLHANIRQLGARTGRMSISDPSLQNMPRSAQSVRGAFVPADPDVNRLVSIDFEQIEMRVFAHFANEVEMIRQVTSGVDLHTAVCRGIYAIPDGEPTPKELRQITKNANFAKVYGAGVAKFAATAGIDETTAKDFLARYDQTFPGVLAFQKRAVEIARKRQVEEGVAYVKAPSGRRHEAAEDKLYTLVNYLIQGTSADVLKRAIVDLDLSGYGDYMLFPIHDEILFEMPLDGIEDATRDAARIMTDNTSFAVPLTVDASPPMERWEK